MILIDGKFYEGDQLVPLEFGNKEQIRLIQEQKNRLEALEGDGLQVDPEIERVTKVSVDFKCICGQTVWFHEKECDDDIDFLEEEMVGEKTSCRKCQRKYIIVINDGDLYVKINKQ